MRHRRRATGGQALVELAFVTVLLTMMLVGAVEVGIAYNNYMLARKATSAGALIGAYGGTDAQVKAAVLSGCESMLATYFFTYGLSDTCLEIVPAEADRCGSIIDYGEAGQVTRRDIGVMLYYQVGFVVPMSDYAYRFELPVLSILPMVMPCARSASAGAPIIPLSIDDGVGLLYGSEYQFKYEGGGGADGNYNCLALGATGGSTYESNLADGYPGTVHAGDNVQTEPGNMSGPTTDGVNARMAGHESHRYSSYEAGCPRVVVIPVLDLDGIHGRTTLPVIHLAKFFLTGVGGSGNQCWVTGTFLEYVE